ncbi:hypothetical protein HDV02_002964 [Globomyces sp. JEL0801]|nr:hypothetical protein HDV02_002964 [Globomyces sp. JEL0801]
MHLLFLANNIRTCYGAWQGSIMAKIHSKTNWAEKYCKTTGASYPNDTRHDLPFDAVKHVIIIPQYKEDLGTMSDTLDTLASHSSAITHYKICLAMEESEKEAPAKAHQLIQKYQSLFHDITFTLHPSNRPGECKGKGSNVAWAAREMVRQAGGPRVEEVFTIMDADTAFAQDYFAAVSYHYAVATPEERNLSMYCPTTLFDRNADQIPFLVRAADISWSIAVMSNLYDGCAAKFPCSAYSIPMTLAASVGFWDTNAQGMAEDFHMALKCFYSSNGHFKITGIYSPASQCNIQGDSYFGTIQDRFTQAKRHMWASLDVGYALRRAFYNILAPSFDAPDDKIQQIPIVAPYEPFFFISKLIPILHKVAEAHLLMGNILLMITFTIFIIPAGENPTFIWSLLTTSSVHPFLAYIADICNYLRIIVAIPTIMTLYYYDIYQKWCSSERWILSLQEQLHPGTGQGVQPLGKRSHLQARRSLLNVLDYLAIPLCGYAFLSIPQVINQIKQLYTSEIVYIVAGKPTVPLDTVTVETEPLLYTNPFVDDKPATTRGDSGFYDFEEPIDPQARFSPSMWKTIQN